MSGAGEARGRCVPAAQAEGRGDRGEQSEEGAGPAGAGGGAEAQRSGGTRGDPRAAGPRALPEEARVRARRGVLTGRNCDLTGRNSRSADGAHLCLGVPDQTRRRRRRRTTRARRPRYVLSSWGGRSALALLSESNARGRSPSTICTRNAVDFARGRGADVAWCAVPEARQG
eukprot:2444896-Rhodomonas_salina.2